MFTVHVSYLVSPASVYLDLPYRAKSAGHRPGLDQVASLNRFAASAASLRRSHLLRLEVPSGLAHAAAAKPWLGIT